MKIKKIYIVIAVIALFIGWIVYSNTNLEINEISVLNGKIDNFRIAQVSDLHNAEFGENNEKLISMLKQADCDIIAITGDIVDSFKTDINVILSFAEKASQIAPTYYVSGNHEAAIAEYEKLKLGLADCGVIVLENQVLELSVGDETISLIGISDPAFNSTQSVAEQLDSVLPDNENYRILLSHRPEYFDDYIGKVDLVLSGHAHGGQFILPFIGGVIAPGQGFFPDYYEGMYTKENTNMIVSRGIGNSIIPFRINNNPEIVVVELSIH